MYLPNVAKKLSKERHMEHVFEKFRLNVLNRVFQVYKTFRADKSIENIQPITRLDGINIPKHSNTSSMAHLANRLGCQL